MSNRSFKQGGLSHPSGVISLTNVYEALKTELEDCSVTMEAAFIDIRKNNIYWVVQVIEGTPKPDHYGLSLIDENCVPFFNRPDCWFFELDDMIRWIKKLEVKEK